MANYNHPSKYRNKICENESLYSKFNAMKARCYRTTSNQYANYGARGITICDEWMNKDTGFDAFADWALSHGYKDDLTIERIDVNKGYYPDNCKWIPRVEQSYNKQNTVWVEFEGERVSLAKLCSEKGLNYQTVYFRIFDIGMGVEDAIYKPLMKYSELGLKAKEHGLSRKLVHDRIYRLGWDEERALNTPARKLTKRKPGPF